MIDLRTQYLGLPLRSPLVSSASPLAQEISNIRRLEDAGAAAIVLSSLFEEQLRLESLELDHRLSTATDSFAEALSFFPRASEFNFGPEEYLKHIRNAKEASGVPIIASLNGSTVGGWTDYARQIEQAGANALECNLYSIPSDPNLAGETVEQNYVDIVRAVKAAVSIPVAVKLSPFFSNIANMAKRLEAAGANGLVLFNRFYQPDIDLDELEIRPNVLLSTPQALRLPLTWIGILYGRIKVSFAATSGVYDHEDVLKLLMVGADVTMFCSALFKHGIYHIREVERDLVRWMEEHEYESVGQMKGSMSQLKCPDPAAFERAQYMRAIKSYQPA